ncbi:MAG: oligosaccharide flippase family protein [Deltaproteobacteria bacterium]|nr:oligosaccharide flippase family protein [Deltaproteobacteria bacterium]MBW2587442.1 oligosaccharide flippase family protein [Deltaproteobacteria bacterium]
MYDKELLRGALVNALGVLAKLAHPLFFVFVTWMFGTEVMGRYLIAIFILQIAVATVTSGYFQATIIFASPHADADAADGEASDALYKVFADAFFVTVAISALLVLAAAFGAEPFVARVYPGRDNLVPALRLLAASLPFTAVARVAVGATKAKMRMEYDAAIFGFAQPVLLLGTAVVVWRLDGGLVGLAASTLASEVCVSLLALMAFRRHFSVAQTLRRVSPLRLSRPMLSFAVPQSLNMTFNRYLTRLDVTMLGAFAFSDHMVGFYGAAALITSTLREVRIAFSGALAPIVARHYAAGEIEALDSDLGRVTRWTTTLVVPVALLLLAMRNDILLVVDASFVGDTSFMAVLLIPPLLSCAFGLAGNFIVFTKHNGWNLLNSVLVAALNTGLNWVLIPRYGLMGAATATAISISIIAALQVVELARLEGVRLRWAYVQPVYLGLLPVVALLVFLGDPAQLAEAWQRLAVGFGLGLGYLGILPFIGHPEARDLLHRYMPSA